MSSLGDGGLMEESFIVCGLVASQLTTATGMVFLNYVLALGLNQLFLIAAKCLTCALFLLPFVLALERNQRQIKVKSTLLIKIGLAAIAGSAYQWFQLTGLKMTSPTIATAMPNLAPGLIFIIATGLRFEKFEIRSKCTRAKILGTLVCLSGALAMSFLQNSPISPTPNESLQDSSYRDWIIGCFYLIVAVIIVSCSFILQASIMVNFPAPFCLCVINLLTTATISTLTQIITEGKLTSGSPPISIPSIIAISLTAGFLSGVPIAFEMWCINKRGPVMVSIFNPIRVVFSAILSAVILRQFLSMGSLAGMLLMFVGLYVVLWAKHKEGFKQLLTNDSVNQPIQDAEEPLLS